MSIEARIIDLFPCFGSHLAEFLEVGHRNDGSLKVDANGQVIPTLLEVLQAGADAGGIEITGLPSAINPADIVLKSELDSFTLTLAAVLAAGSNAGGTRITNLGSAV